MGVGNLLAAADWIVDAVYVVKRTADGVLPDNNSLRIVEKETTVADVTVDSSKPNTSKNGVHEAMVDESCRSEWAASNEKGIGLDMNRAGKFVL